MLTQSEIEDQLEQLVERMETQTEMLGRLTVSASATEVEYKRAYAIAYTRGVGAVKDKEQTATLATIEALQLAKHSEAVMKSQQEALRTTRAAVDALRTLAANVRAQV